MNGAECFDGYVWDNSFPMSYYQYLNYGVGVDFVTTESTVKSRLEGMIPVLKDNAGELLLDDGGNIQVSYNPKFENILFTKKEPRSR